MKTATRRQLCTMASLAGLSIAAAALPVSALTLAENGQPRATIVVSQAALEPAKDDSKSQKIAVAARDLQEYLHRLSGARLPIQGDGQTPDGPLILVGASRLTAALPLSIPAGLTPARREEGFVIQSSGDKLVLAGNDAGPYHGTEYAVYDFLERQGVRWFMPGEYGEYVPRNTSLKTGSLSVRETPDFVQRNWWLHATPEMAVQESRWKIRNKMNPDLMFMTPTDGSVRNFMPAPEVAATNPELFAKRADGTVNPHHPNLSNPKTVEYAAEKAKAFFRANPTAGSVGIAPDDGMPRDFNAETLKVHQGFSDLVGREGVPAEMSTTEEWMGWINAIAREVKQEFPDRIITTNGYANRNMAPFGMAIDPNVSIMFAAIWSDTLHAYDDPRSWQAIRQAQLMQQWCALNDKVWVYGYDYTMLVTSLTPVPTTRKLIRDFPLMKKWGIVGFNDETRNVWAERGIATKYLKARLEWNANADAAALLNDYFTTWYGAAAKPARAFWDALEETIESTPLLGHEDRVLPYVYSPALMQKLKLHLGAAQRLAATPREKQHVETDNLILQHLQAYIAMNDAEFAGDFAGAAAAGERMLQLRVQLHAIDPFLMPAREKNETGGIDYNSGVFYWGVQDRINYYRDLAARLSGKTGDLLKLLPEKAAFQIDARDEGRFAGWYKPGWNTAAWKNVATTIPFYLQGYMDKTGYPYLGMTWYQFKTEIPAPQKGRKVMLYAPVLETEAWVWVNGQYIGHRPYRESYERPNELEFDITAALKTGQKNVITFRVSTSQNRTAAAGGFGSRLFVYSPKAAP